ncbi:MAG: MBG domain-containing protein, partial [Clostridia bacterium]
MEKRIKNVLMVSIIIVAIVLCATVVTIFATADKNVIPTGQPMSETGAWFDISDKATLITFLDGGAGNTNGRLVADFDLDWDNIGSPKELRDNYVLDGNGHIITFSTQREDTWVNSYPASYNANGCDYNAGGLFVWRVGAGAVLQNINFTNSNYKFLKKDKQGNAFGVACGVNDGTIKNIKVNVNADIQLLNNKPKAASELWQQFILGGVTGLNRGNIFNANVRLQNQLYTGTNHEASCASWGFVGGIAGKSTSSGNIQGATVDFAGGKVYAGSRGGRTGSNNNLAAGFVGYNEGVLNGVYLPANPNIQCDDQVDKQDIACHNAATNTYKKVSATVGGIGSTVSADVNVSWKGDATPQIVLTPVKAKAATNEIVWTMDGKTAYRQCSYSPAFDLQASGSVGSGIVYGELGTIEYTPDVNTIYDGREHFVTARYTNALTPSVEWKAERLFSSFNVVTKNDIKGSEYLDEANHRFIPEPTVARTFVIAPATLRVSAAYFTAPATKEYDGTKAVVGDIVNNNKGLMSEPIAITSQAEYLDAGVNANAKIRITYKSANQNYQFAPDNANVTVECPSKITKKNVTVAVNNASKIYGDADPTFTATWSGFVGGDDATKLGLNGQDKFTCADKVNVGARILSMTTLSAANYSFTFLTGTYTISQRAVTITTVGDNVFNANYTIAGLVGSDKINGQGNGKTEVESAGTINFAAPNANYTVSKASFVVNPLSVAKDNANISAIGDGVTASANAITFSKRIASVKIVYTMQSAIAGHLPSLKFVAKQGTFDTAGESAINNQTLTFSAVTGLANLAAVNVGEIARMQFNFAAVAEENGAALVNAKSTCVGKYGDMITFVAKPNANFHFAGWFNGTTAVSFQEKFVTKATKDLSLTAKFVADGEVTVKFLYVDGSVYKTIAAAKSESVENLMASCSITEPQLYQRFIGWRVQSQNATNIVFVPVFESTSAQNVVATINGVAKTYRFNQMVTLTPTKQNGFWTVNGIVVQQGGNFEFNAINDVVI